MAKITEQIAGQRRELREALDQDALSVKGQIVTCDASARLWHSLAVQCLEEAAEALARAKRARKPETKLAHNAQAIAFEARAAVASATAAKWEHAKRLAQKLTKVDELREVAARLDRQEATAKNFGAEVDERARAASIANLRLEKAARSARG